MIYFSKTNLNTDAEVSLAKHTAAEGAGDQSSKESEKHKLIHVVTKWQTVAKVPGGVL